MFLIAIFVMGCGGAAGRTAAPVAAQPVQVDFSIHGEEAPAGAEECCAAGARSTRDGARAMRDDARPTTRDQPPEVKLKLGHYRSSRFGIGLVIDRTAEEAKVQFDGTAQTLRLFPQYFWHRTEYHRARNEKLLEVRSDGQIILHMEGAGEGIWLFRDGDADPL
jgi:hypothetical protein